MMKILAVDDEKQMADSIRDNLVFEGYDVDCAYGGQQALDNLLREKYSLIILDVMMPDVDGFKVLEDIRKNNNDTPVIFLTARVAEADKLRGLGLGADDYMAKPFSILELIARVKAILNRTTPGSTIDNLEIGKTKVHLSKLIIKMGGQEKELGRYEADILRLLASEPGRVFSRDEILDNIWGIDVLPSNRTIDNYMVKIRQKIEPDPKQPKHLISIYGKGYKLVFNTD